MGYEKASEYSGGSENNLWNVIIIVYRWFSITIPTVKVKSDRLVKMNILYAPEWSNFHSCFVKIGEIFTLFLLVGNKRTSKYKCRLPGTRCVAHMMLIDKDAQNANYQKMKLFILSRMELIKIFTEFYNYLLLLTRYIEFVPHN